MRSDLVQPFFDGVERSDDIIWSVLDAVSIDKCLAVGDPLLCIIVPRLEGRRDEAYGAAVNGT